MAATYCLERSQGRNDTVIPCTLYYSESHLSHVRARAFSLVSGYEREVQLFSVTLAAFRTRARANERLEHRLFHAPTVER